MYLGRIEKLLSAYSPVPMCVINSKGKVTRAGGSIDEVFKYDGIVDADIFVLTGIKLPDIIEAAGKKEPLSLKKNDKVFKVIPGMVGEGEMAAIVLYFVDVTSFENLKDMYNDDKACIAVVSVDNFDEFVSSKGEDREMEISTEIDKLLRCWTAKMGAAITRYKEHMYYVVLSQKSLKILIDKKFCILDEAREIETESDFPVTLSIGIGAGGKSLAETDQYAVDALNMALGRGGDQAVVKNVRNFEYYGGKSQSVEKGFKGKSRVIAHALKLVMSQSSKIFIMGHKNPDMDCLGSALGIHRVAEIIGKEAYIIINSYSDSLAGMLEDAKETGEYEFVSTEKALGLLDENSLVIVVDTHTPALVESMEILSRVSRTVVIDHHRRTADSLQNMILSYMESYASSASELVTEIVQYACDKKALTKMEADALLAGIMVDTNRFAVKAGVRTFEAASWLKRNGADLASVRKYFQDDAESFRIKARCVADARLYEDGIAMSLCPGESVNSQIINSQVADELLEIKGIKASFVAGKNQHGRTVISARSLGAVNVQVVMEKFGGGGHLTTAGAQVDMSPEEALKAIREAVREQL